MVSIIKETKKEQSLIMIILGTILLILRFFSFLFKRKVNYFETEICHVSYILSFFAGFSLLCSFRQIVLNSFIYIFIPSFFFSIPLNDFPNIKIEKDLIELINIYTLHIPTAIISIWIFLNRKDLVSIEGIFNSFIFICLYFLIIDDKKNGTIEGIKYILLTGVIIFSWLFISYKFLNIGKNLSSPYYCPLIILK